MTQKETEDLIKYYIDLLIIQYNDKPKARGTIESFVKEAIKDDLFDKVENGYDIETAVGVQLDIMGQYIGLDRSGSILVPNLNQNLFSLAIDGTAVDDVTAFGLVPSADFLNVDAHILGANNNDFLISSLLSDEQYRFVLKLKVIQNTINHSEKAISDGLVKFFAQDLVASGVDGKMIMTYFVNVAVLANAKIALQKGVLPRPIGVGLPYIIINPPTRNFFGLAFGGVISSNTGGLSFGGVVTSDSGKLLSINDLEFM